MWAVQCLLFVSWMLGSVAASGGTIAGFREDPYLKYQPKYAYALPIQILLTGMVVALLFVLLVHLIFTVQYHWALARRNYMLQLSGVCALLLSQISTLVVVLSNAYHVSRKWPYMLDYIAVGVPIVSPEERKWSRVQVVWWYIMLFITSALVNATHIQFLTFLYPSRIERRLIFYLIGPLAAVSAGMEFCGLSENDKTIDLGHAIRDICNSTLTLLFTCALFIWGFLLNRKQAWRTDGGTAVFGAGALILAVISTVVNFVQIVEEELEWLPGLLWAVVSWQSFLGWWWWVGSGLGVGEVEDMILKEQQKRDSKLRKRHRKGNKRSRVAPPKNSDDDNESPDENVLTRWTRGVIDASSHFAIRRRRPSRDSGSIALSEHPHDAPSSPPTQRRSRRFSAPTSSQPSIHNHTDSSQHLDIPAPQPQNVNQPQSSSASTNTSAGTSTSATTTSATNTTTTTTSPHPQTATAPPTPNRILQSRPLSSVLQFWYKLRHAHQSAAQAQAIEQVELRAQVYGPESAELGGAGGWGLGNFGLREREEAERRMKEFQDEQRRGQLVPGEGDAESERADSARVGRSVPTPRKTHGTPPWAAQTSGSSWWWWSPFRRWRRQDATVY